MSQESNTPRDEPSPADHPTNAPDEGRVHRFDTRHRVLAATLEAEIELLERRCEELANANEELVTEVEELEAELDQKRRELREVVTRYERLLEEHRDETTDGDSETDYRSDGSTVLAATARVRDRIFHSGT